MAELVADHHEVDVASGDIASFRDGAVDESGGDFISVSAEGPAKRTGKTDRLEDDTVKLRENGRSCIGLIVLLIADPLHRDKAAFGEAIKLAHHRAGA